MEWLPPSAAGTPRALSRGLWWLQQPQGITGQQGMAVCRGAVHQLGSSRCTAANETKPGLFLIKGNRTAWMARWEKETVQEQQEAEGWGEGNGGSGPQHGSSLVFRHPLRDKLLFPDLREWMISG